MPMYEDESILDNIKKLLGQDAEYTEFDTDIIISINSAFANLNQLGVGSSEGFVIRGNDATWGEFLGTRKDLESVKTYIYLKTRLVFDPPQTSFLIEAIKEQIKEIEWRLNVQAEGGGF